MRACVRRWIQQGRNALQVKWNNRTVEVQVAKIGLEARANRCAETANGVGPREWSYNNDGKKKAVCVVVEGWG